MKPGRKRTRRRTDDEDGGGGASPFNMGSLKKAIEAIDVGKESSINLSSLSVALSAASREMKQTGKSKRKRVRGSRKKKKKKLAIGTKPKTNAELRRWFSNLDKSLKDLKLSLQLCELNTDFTMNHCVESFR